MQPKSIAIVGAAETTRLGVIPDTSQIQLHADAALNAMADAGLKPADIDGIATAGETPVTVAHYLGLTPKWVDGTAVGGCSFMIHVRHAAAAIASGLCETVLITHGESGRSGVGRSRNVVGPTCLGGQFEQSRMGRWGRRLWRRPLLHAFRHGRRACAICAGPPSPKSPTPRSRSTTVWAACSPQAALSSCRTRCPRPWCISGIPKLTILM
jgi:acetyl-CoA acetyltransferase